MSKFKGLNQSKGLDALFASANINPSAILKPTQTPSKDTIVDVQLHKLQAGAFQPRSDFDEAAMVELANSIKQHGVLQPILVRPVGLDKYEIIAGERRYRACLLAELATIPAIIHDYDDKQTLAISLIENLQREDLNIVEEARGYQRLVEEFQLTHEELGNITGKSRSNISNTLRLLNLCPEVLDYLMRNELGMGHARALIGLSEEQQIKLAVQSIQEELTTAEVENLVAKLKNENKLPLTQKSPQAQDVNIKDLESKIADVLAMSVNIKHKKSGGGSVVINYHDLDELDNLLNHFK